MLARAILSLSLDHVRRFLQLTKLEIGIRIIRIHQHTDRRSSRKNFVQKPQTLGLQCRPEQAHARDIAFRSIEACDEASLDRIGGTNEDDWNLSGRCFCHFSWIASASSRRKIL